MSKLLVYRCRVGAPVGSLPPGTVFESGGIFYIKIIHHTDSGDLEQPVINLSSFELEFMDEDERVLPVETAKLNIT